MPSSTSPLSDFKVYGNINHRSPLAERIVRYLKRLPYKHVIVRNELQAAVGLASRTNLDMSVTLPQIQPYRCLYGKSFLYGSKKTIAELKRRLNKE